MTDKVYALNPFEESPLSIEVDDLKRILEMTKSGISLYLHILNRNDDYIFHDGIAYIDPKLSAKEMGISVKSIYNGVDDLSSKGILSRTGRSKEYFYNPKFFPNEFVKER